MEPWQSWALAVGVGGSLFWYYTIHDKNGRAKKAANKAFDAVADAVPDSVSKAKQKDRPAKKQESRPIEPTKSSMKEVDKARDGAKQAKKRSNLKPTFQIPTAAGDLSQDTAEDPNEDSGTTDWAKQLVANKTGVSFVPSSQNQQKVKTQRVSGSGSRESEDSRTPSGKDVSDMLEAPQPGPSILNITGDAKEKKAKPAAATQQQQALSKKQRQRQKKRETEKAQAEADEQQRRSLMEQQRRGAREARGEPAKNGLTAAQAPTNGAWSSGSSGVKPAARADLSSTALLDTFENEPAGAPLNVATRTAETSEPVTSAAAAPSADGAIRGQAVPDEEEQIRLLTEQDGWEEVPSKTQKKNKKKVAPIKTSSSPEISEPPTPDHKTTTMPPRLVNGVNQEKQKQKSANNYAALQRDEVESEDEPAATKPRPVVGHPLDSDWAV